MQCTGFNSGSNFGFRFIVYKCSTISWKILCKLSGQNNAQFHGLFVYNFVDYFLDNMWTISKYFHGHSIELFSELFCGQFYGFFVDNFMDFLWTISETILVQISEIISGQLQVYFSDFLTLRLLYKYHKIS